MTHRPTFVALALALGFGLPGLAQAQTQVPNLEITFDTSIANDLVVEGYYQPANVVAAWVTDELGGYIKTIYRSQSGYAPNLTAHSAVRVIGELDVVTGATRQNHLTPVIASWNLEDLDGNLLPNGTYQLHLELADSNSAPPDNLGTNNLGTYSFTIDGTPGTVPLLDGNGFTNIAVTYSLVDAPIEPEPEPGTDPSEDPDPTDPSDDTDEFGQAGGTVNGGCASAGMSATLWSLLGVLGFLLFAVRRRQPARTRR